MELQGRVRGEGGVLGYRGLQWVIGGLQGVERDNTGGGRERGFSYRQGL